MNQTDQTNQAATFEAVKQIVVNLLGIEDRAASIDEATELLGGLPEFDSIAVVEVITAIEANCGISFDGNEITADIFQTVGALVDFVSMKLRS